VIRTPLLIPSFSSRGFGGEREVGKLLDVSKEQLTDSMLISAYDLYHKLIKRPRRAIANITFVDSGGYETSDLQDLSTVFVQAWKHHPWTKARLRQVYDSWPDYVPAVFVNYDDRGSVVQQGKRALSLLRSYPKHLHAFLVKPKRKEDRFISVDEIINGIDVVEPFHILGITEKELGSSMIDRMDAIARIRLALDDAGLQRVALHIFGGLDPITVPLYFIAGAEIFDGLTWLRFGFCQGAAWYRQNSGVRLFGVHYSDDHVKLLTLQQNLLQLSELTMQLRRFLIDLDFTKLSPNEMAIRNAYDLLRTRNPRFGGNERVA